MPETIDYPTAPFEEAYAWLGYRALQLVFGLLDEVAKDPSTTLDVLAYDFNELDVTRAMLKLAPRLRLFQADSATHVTQGGRVRERCSSPTSAEWHKRTQRPR